MKQIWPNYSYSPTTNVLTLTGLNIDRDQLLLVSAPERGRIMYNFADSSVTASAFTAGANTGLTLVASTAGLTTTASLVIYYDDQVAGISGTVTASNLTSALAVYTGGNSDISVNIKSVGGQSFGQGQTWVPVAIAEGSLPAGTNRIGVVTIGAGTVTIGAGTAQIGSVTASISGTVPISISSVTIGNSVTIGSLPAISGTVTANIGNAVVIQLVGAVQDGDGTTFGVDRDFPVSGAVQIQAGSNQIGSVTANTFALQGTAVTTSNFTSTTASTVLANFNATREVLTIFNEGAGNLHIAPGATCTTIAYQVRLSSGDYYEAPSHQTTITHSAVFATAGTARICQVS